jgi:hypothetical protein
MMVEQLIAMEEYEVTCLGRKLLPNSLQQGGLQHYDYHPYIKAFWLSSIFERGMESRLKVKSAQ